MPRSSYTPSYSGSESVLSKEIVSKTSSNWFRYALYGGALLLTLYILYKIYKRRQTLLEHIENEHKLSDEEHFQRLLNTQKEINIEQREIIGDLQSKVNFLMKKLRENDEEMEKPLIEEEEKRNV